MAEHPENHASPDVAPHRDASPPHHGRILVGYDGSAASCAALTWATHQAELTGAEVVVCSTWGWPDASVRFGSVLPEGFDPEAEIEHALDGACCATHVAHPSVTLRGMVVSGDPGTLLVEASKDADLLVVGTRGHGRVLGALLGSVSEYCVANAHCPVVVVRAVAQSSHAAVPEGSAA